MTSTQFFQKISSPAAFRLYLLQKLPAAFFAGLKLRSINAQEAVVTVPYRWSTKNPFRSTYFACLAMAAEMSTGVLAMAFTLDHKPGVSMLVTGLDGRFFKKATGVTRFVCADGERLKQAVEAAVHTGEGQVFEALSTGYNEAGEVVCEFRITWSFRQRK